MSSAIPSTASGPGSRNRLSISSSSHGLWDISPPPKVVENHKLDKGQVDTFFPDKGYGFMETAEGRLFFHASGFRVPRMTPGNDKEGNYTQEIQLAQVRPKPKPALATPDVPVKPLGPIPVPIIMPGMGLMFLAGMRNDRRQALTWCLQDMYESLLNELDARYKEEAEAWRRLGRYRLNLCERRQSGALRADNLAKGFVPETRVVRTNLFEGTNLDYLKDWFRGCRETYRLTPNGHPNPDRWIELFYQIFDEPANGYGEWQQCDAATMHDFLG